MPEEIRGSSFLRMTGTVLPSDGKSAPWLTRPPNTRPQLFLIFFSSPGSSSCQVRMI